MNRHKRLSPADFYTVSRASQGVKVDLVDPEGNREWAIVRSVISHEFRRRSDDLAVRAMRSRAMEPREKKLALRVARAQLAESLIADWSIEESPADVFIQNPRLRRQIERIAEDINLHFGVQP